MTTKQENKITMWNVVNNYLTVNNAVWSVLVALLNSVTRFRTKLTLTSTYISSQSVTTKGVTTDKTTARNLAITQGVIISNILQSFAKDTVNNTLFTDMNFPKSRLMHFADTTHLINLQLIYSTANANLAALATYGITAAKLTAYQTLITNYSNLLTAPRARAVNIKTATKDLGLILKDGSNELKTMDKLIGSFSAANPDFVLGYYNSRIILDLGTGSTKIKITVLDAKTNEFIENATITNSINGIILTTNQKGEYIGNMPFGVYNFTCSAINYVPQILTERKVKLGRKTGILFLLKHV